MICGSAGDNRCGVGDYAYELVQHLALDAEVHLYFDRNHKPASPPFSKLSTLELHPGGFSMFNAGRLVKELCDEGYDIVHLQYPSRGFGTSLVPGFLPQRLTGMNSRSRFIVTLHEWTTSHPLRRMVMDQMLPYVDAIIVSNETEMEKLVIKTAGKDVYTIPVGNVLRSRTELENVWVAAEGGRTDSLPAPSGINGRKPFSLFHYGLPAKGKGLERLLQAMKLVRESGVPVELYLGGDYPPGDKATEDLLKLITDLSLTDAVIRLGHIPRERLEPTAGEHCLAVFPFDEGFSSKRSSVATISHLDLPVLVGGGSRETHPYYAPEQNTAAALSVMIIELFKGRLEQEWVEQVNRQREYAKRFSFAGIAAAHLDIYRRLRKVDA